jgi:arylsulfatase A-like enzyme
MEYRRARMRRLANGAWIGAVAGAIAGVLDATLACLRGPALAVAFVVSCGLLALFGALLGVFAAMPAVALARAWAPVLAERTDVRAFGLVVLAALVGAAQVLVAIGRWAFGSEPPLALVAVLVAAVVAAGLAMAGELEVRLRSRPRAQLLVLAVVLGVAMLLVRGLVDAGEGVDLRPFAVLAVFGLAALVLPLASPPPRARPIAIGLAIVVVAAPAVLATRLDARFVAARHAPLSGLAARTLGRVLDLDADGFNPLFGEGDCAPWDGDVHPLGDEVPDNGRDDDCFAGDVDGASLAARTPVPLSPVRPEDPMHVVLVTIDTLRADRVGAYGYRRDTTPTIDRLAAEGALFERAYSSSPVTDRSLPTMLGGLYPSMYTEALDYEAHELADRRVLFPERLQAAGWRTVVVSSTEIILRDNLDQGIDDLDLRSVMEKDASTVSTRALEKLLAHADREPRTPLFLWVHYYDPHGPYEPPRTYRHWDDGGRATAENRSARYDAEVAYVDDEMSRIVSMLKRLEMWDHTLFVVTSDHGEEFMDHGGWYHAEELYDESVRVPLIVRLPGGTPGGRRIAETVGLVDLMPTLLELVDIPAPGGIEGRSQAAAIRGTGPADAHPVFLEQWKHKTDIVQKIGVVDGRHKMILDLENQLFELYDVAEDPRERVNRYADDPETASRLRGILLDYWAMVRAAKQLAPEHGAF